MRKNSFAPAEESVTVKHDDAGAFVAFHFNIGAGADDGPFIRAAGMGFAGFDYISDQNCFVFHYAIFQGGFPVATNSWAAAHSSLKTVHWTVCLVIRTP